MKKKIIFIFITILAVITLGIFILTYNNTIIGFGEEIHFSASGTKDSMPQVSINDSMVSGSRVYFIIEVHGITQEDFKEKYEILSIELNGTSQKYRLESPFEDTFNIRIVPNGGYNDSDNEIIIKLKNKNSNRIKNIKLNAELTEVC